MATKVLTLAKLTKFVSETKKWVQAAITKAVGALKLENITDVEASVTEVNYLKGVTSDVQSQLNGKAPLDSPELTGKPTAPTAIPGTTDKQVATTEFVKDAVDTAVGNIKANLGSALIYKGSVADYDSLPKEGQTKGDTYNVVASHGNTPAGTNYAWNGEDWDPLGGDIDLSGFATKTDLQSYQPKGNYLTGSDFEEISDTEIEEAWKDAVES